MSTQLPQLQDFSDHLSPMVVKEMRQGLRTRFFTAALILFHVVLGLLMLGFLFDVRPEDAHEMFWVIIITTLLGILPARAWNILYHEAKDGTLDMLVLTGMSSFRIVWGKWVSLYSQTLLVVSSLLPYMVARYQLGGVEIVRELVGLYLLILGSAVITAGMVAFSSQSLILIRLLFSALVGLVAFGFGTYVYVLTTESFGERLLEYIMPSGLAETLMLWVGLSGLSAYLVYVLLCIGSARLPMMKNSQGTVKRIVALIVLIVITASIWWMLWMTPRYTQSTMVPALMFLIPFTLLIGMDVLTEAAPAMLGNEKFPKFYVLSGFFGSGWPSGVFFYTFISLLALSAVGAIEMRDYSSSEMCQSLCLFACIFMANIIPVCIPIFRKQSRLAQWLVCQFLVFAIGLVMAIVIGSLPSDKLDGWLYFTVISPISVLFGHFWVSFTDSETLLLNGTYISLLWVLAAMFLAIREINRLRALAISTDSTSPTDAKVS